MLCGCFCCRGLFPGTEVVEWIDDGDTPLCPECGIAAVLSGVTDLSFLRGRHFGPHAGMPLPDAAE